MFAEIPKLLVTFREM